MKYVSHSYQEYAKDFIVGHKVSTLLLEMGLGKSLTELTAIDELIYDRFEMNKLLIITPLRVATSTWPNEIEKWEHLKRLTYSVVVGIEKELLSALSENVNIYIINRENVDWLVNKSGVAFNFDMLVIDELSSFKSYSAKQFKSLLKVRSTFKRVVGLTGTPSSNGLMDLWAEFRILDLRERLGRYITHYRSTYFIPDKRNDIVIYSYKPQANAEDRIYKKISDITISMKTKNHLKMTDLVMNKVKVELDNKEKAKYETFRKEMIMQESDIESDIEIDAVNAASLSNKLLQIASGSICDEDRKSYSIHDKKLDTLEDLIEGANGKPVLVAYWFKSDKE